MKPVRQLQLANGLTVRFFNHNRRYFGDYHQVKVEIVCEVPLREDYFAGRGEFEEAIKVLGGSVHFRRYVEKMGVSSAELGPVLDSVIRHFSEHSLSYLASPEFPRKLIAGELASSTRRPLQRSFSG